MSSSLEFNAFKPTNEQLNNEIFQKFKKIKVAKLFI